MCGEVMKREMNVELLMGTIILRVFSYTILMLDVSHFNWDKVIP